LNNLSQSAQQWESSSRPANVLMHRRHMFSGGVRRANRSIKRRNVHVHINRSTGEFTGGVQFLPPVHD
jgi:hypothetical protein